MLSTPESRAEALYARNITLTITAIAVLLCVCILAVFPSVHDDPGEGINRRATVFCILAFLVVGGGIAAHIHINRYNLCLQRQERGGSNSDAPTYATAVNVETDAEADASAKW